MLVNKANVINNNILLGKMLDEMDFLVKTTNGGSVVYMGSG